MQYMTFSGALISLINGHFLLSVKEMNERVCAIYEMIRIFGRWILMKEWESKLRSYGYDGLPSKLIK